MTPAQKRNLTAYIDANLELSARLLHAGNTVGAVQTAGQAIKSLSRLL